MKFAVGSPVLWSTSPRINIVLDYQWHEGTEFAKIAPADNPKGWVWAFQTDLRPVESIYEESSGDFLARIGTDAHKWAKEYQKRYGGDEGNLIGWFANAIEAGRTEAEAATRAEKGKIIEQLPRLLPEYLVDDVTDVILGKTEWVLESYEVKIDKNGEFFAEKA